MADSKIDLLMDQVIDVLIEDGGYFSAGWSKVLSALASRIDGEDVKVGDLAYRQVSKAVLRLETLGFVAVDRAYRDRAEKANIIEGIRLL